MTNRNQAPNPAAGKPSSRRRLRDCACARKRAASSAPPSGPIHRWGKTSSRFIVGTSAHAWAIQVMTCSNAAASPLIHDAGQASQSLALQATEAFDEDVVRVVDEDVGAAVLAITHELEHDLLEFVRGHLAVADHLLRVRLETLDVVP